MTGQVKEVQCIFISGEKNGQIQPAVAGGRKAVQKNDLAAAAALNAVADLISVCIFENLFRHYSLSMDLLLDVSGVNFPVPARPFQGNSINQGLDFSSAPCV